MPKTTSTSRCPSARPTHRNSSAAGHLCGSNPVYPDSTNSLPPPTLWARMSMTHSAGQPRELLQPASLTIHAQRAAAWLRLSTREKPKAPPPATSMVILGLKNCSLTKVCSLDPAKVTKYSVRISQLLNVGHATKG